jgi:hypothetical protein
MHVSNLLGAIEVVLEDVVADCQLLNLRTRRGEAAPASAADAARYARQLSLAFALHQRLFDLARGGAKAGGGKGKKVRRATGAMPCAGTALPVVVRPRLLHRTGHAPGHRNFHAGPGSDAPLNPACHP